MRIKFLFYFIFFILNNEYSYGRHESSKKLSTITSEILEDAEAGAKIGGVIGGVPAAITGVVPGAAIGAIAAIPFALASSVTIPIGTLCTGNIFLAPIMVFAAPAYTLGLGAVGGAYCGGMVAGASGLIAGTSMGALLGIAKGTACHLREIPPSIHDQVFGDPIKRRICRNEEKIQKNMLTLLEKRDLNQGESLHCSICHESIENNEKFYIFRHCQCKDKGICEECQEAFLRHHLQGYDFPTDCPGGCGYPVTEVDIERLCSNEADVKRFKRNMLKSLVCTQSNIRFCPTEDCINGKKVDSPQDAHWSCDVCHFKGCILCGESNTSKNHTCDYISAEINKILKKGKMKRDPSDPSKGTIRPCYYCGKIINRIDGCNSVRCTECKKTFHWNKGNRVSHDYDNGEMEYEPLKDPHF